MTLLFAILFALTLVVLAVVILYARARRKRYRKQVRKALQKKIEELYAGRMGRLHFIGILDKLRTPFDRMDSAVAVLGSQKGLAESGRAQLEILRSGLDQSRLVLEQAETLRSLVEKKLALSLHRSQPLGPSVRKIMDGFKADASLAGISLTATLPPDDIHLPLDTGIFESILFDMLLSAMKYTRPNVGSIRIHVNRTDRDGVSWYVPLREGDTSKAYVYVAMYCTEAAMEKAAPELQLTGRLAELHHGYLWVADSDAGKGIRLMLALPEDESAYPDAQFLREEARPEQDGIQASEEDRNFYAALVNVLRENLSDENFDIAGLAEKLGMSRSTLFSRVKDVTGNSPKQLLNEFRLRTAANLLAKGEMTVSEVADATGWGSLSYFSKSYKRRFGHSPAGSRN